jgi:hypothetical protein
MGKHCNIISSSVGDAFIIKTRIDVHDSWRERERERRIKDIIVAWGSYGMEEKIRTQTIAYTS